MSWKTHHNERLKKLRDALASGRPIEIILEELKLSAAKANRLLASQEARNIIEQENKLRDMQRGIVLQRHQIESEQSLAAELADGSDPARQARSAKALRQLQRSDLKPAEKGLAREALPAISEDEARAACHDGAKAFEREAGETFAS